ncbi:MAG: patatin-like phospholipase family protein [Oscillospiraceae bacterium]|jgi:NTE family protein|nr:patatin-like phospholipase family protein [Oscillospiraceae bacterium]
MYGLALEGGGTLGAAHLGVLRALHEYGIIPSAIGGTSAGSMIAAAYGWRGQLSDVEELFADVTQLGPKLLDLNITGIMSLVTHWFAHRDLHYLGVFKGNRLEKLMNDHLEGAMLAQARLPLVIPSVDLISRELVLYTSRLPRDRGLDHWERDASIAQAVRASTSIPIVFAPKEIDSGMMVDGGVLQNLPISSVRQLGESRVLGVSLHVAGEDTQHPDNVMGVARSMISAVGKQMERRQRQEATYLLEIILPEGSGTFSFDRMDQFVDIGYETTIKAIPAIRAAFAQSVPAMARRAAVLSAR